MSKTAAIVLAAGKGSRMKSQVQKQYLLLKERPVLYYSLKAFQDSRIDEIVLVTGKGEVEYCQKEIVEKYGLTKVKKIVTGGAERYQSVYNGLLVLKDVDIVLIHDGARPFVTQDIIERTIEGIAESGAAVAAMPVKDTIKLVDEAHFVKETPNRSYIWQVQTPQTFDYQLIRRAYDLLAESGMTAVTDDAMVVESMIGSKVKLVEGAYTNIKITTPEDMLIANAIF